MADDNVVAVQVRADVGSYVDAMKQAAQATRSSTDAITSTVTTAADQASAAMEAMKTSATEASETLAQSMKASAAAAHEGGASLSSFGDKIREMGNEHRSEQRFGSFIARDLQTIVPAAGEAGAAVSEMVSGLAYGSGIAVAIGAVKLLASAFGEGESAVEKFSKESADALAKIKEQAAEIVAAMHGETATQSFERKSVDPVEKARDDAYRQLEDAKARLARAQDLEMSELAQGDAAGSGSAKELAAVTEATDKLAVAEANLRGAREAGGKIAAEEATKTAAANAQAAEASFQSAIDSAAKEGAERERIQRAVDAKLAAIHVQMLDGNEKLEAEYVKNIDDIDKMAGSTATQREALKTDTLMAYRKQLVDFAAAQQVLEVERVKAAAAELKNLGEQIAAPLRELMPAIDKQTNDAIEAQKRLARAALQADEQRVRSSLGAAKQMGDAFGASVAGIITGSESATKALASMAAAGVKAFLDMEIQAIEADAVARTRAIATAATTVTSNAASAASGAAASQAGIPIIGPGLAIAAMAAMEAAVLGLLSALPSAAGGWGDVPHDLTANIHKGEQVWPAQYAEGGRQLLSMLADGEGMGGGDVHLHVHTASVREFVAYLGQSEVQRGISQLVRTGRWAG